MNDDPTWTVLGAVEQATTAVLTLAEGLSDAELLSSRLTRREVRRQLLLAASALDELGEHGHALFPELDWAGFRAAAQGLCAGGGEEDTALCTGVNQLAPSALSWIRLYRARPERKDAP